VIAEVVLELYLGMHINSVIIAILNKSGLSESYKFVESNPHPRLWRFVADAALGALDFEVARKAFIQCSDYQGIQFVKKLEKLDVIFLCVLTMTIANNNTSIGQSKAKSRSGLFLLVI
jgi:hypothetical protein